MRLQEKVQAELLVHEGYCRAVGENVSACLRKFENVTVEENVELTLIPIESSNRSFTLPTPGTFRIGKSCMKAFTASEENSSMNWPFGLFCVVTYQMGACGKSRDDMTLSEQI